MAALSVPSQSDALRTDHLHADLTRRSVRGGFLAFGSQACQFFLSAISTIVLARLLAPDDFGLVAMVTGITALGQAFADLGLSEATIQREDISHDQVSTLFWINVGVGLALMLATAALAPVLVWFYREPRLKDLTLVVSLNFLVVGLRVQHEALLRRQMQFFRVAIRDLTVYIVGVPVAIGLAFHGAGYWAIVGLPLAINTTSMVLSWVMAGWIPGRPGRGVNMAPLIAFGGGVAGSYLINSVIRSADTILIGWYWAAGPLGLYSRAHNLLMLPVRQFNAPASRVAVSAFSRTQSEPERLARYYLRGVNLMMWINTPVVAFLFVAAQPVIVLVLGSKWGEAVPVFQILAISAAGQLLYESVIWLLVGRGESKRMLRLHLIMAPFIVSSFALGLPFGIKGVALSGSLVLLAMCPWMLMVAFRGTTLNLPRLARAIRCPVLVALFAVGAAECAVHFFKPQGTLPQLFVTAVCFAVTYAAALLVPAVRREITSFRELLLHFRPLKQPA